MFDRLVLVMSEQTAAAVHADAQAPTNLLVGGINYELPADWPPLEGEIDLNVHDLPHESSNTEWWYINSHVKDPEGKEYSLHIAFFRVSLGRSKETGELRHAHSITGNIIDPNTQQAHFFSYLDPNSPKVLKFQLDSGQYDLDPRLKRAMTDIVARGNVPLPDILLTEHATIGTDRLNLDFTRGNTMVSNPDGTYDVLCTCEEKNLSFKVKFTPTKSVQRQGNNGVVQVGIKRETMFYYFIPRGLIEGTVTLDGRTFPVTGTGWYDHEFGGGLRENIYLPSELEGQQLADPKKGESDQSFAWNWYSMQLDQGSEITATNLVNITTNEVTDNFIVYIDADGKRSEHRDFTLTSDTVWTSVRSANQYPLNWHFSVPSLQLELDLKAEFANQEVFTLLSRPAYWEGRLRVTGTILGKEVTGKCFLERHGFDHIDSLDFFFKKISGLVRKEIRKVLPLEPTRQELIDLLANDEMEHYMEGVSTEVMLKTLIEPLRAMIDLGGKSWRSYALLLCIDAVGGNSFDYEHWLAMPEMMHVGSLIIDDIQDKSVVRRGGECCHITYGEPLAINAGTAAYFLAMHILQKNTKLTDKMRNKLYELYFLTLRAGHCGQGFDIYGLSYLMDNAIKTGDTEALLKGVVCTHRLKSAVPAGNLARMGALVGGGTHKQSEALGMYFEAIGVAFQVIDDVLNLEGMKSADGTILKSRGEDLHEGKITYPVARAMGLFTTPEQREQFWVTLQTKPDYPIVEELISQLESVDAIQQSRRDARDMVEKAFLTLDDTIPDSFYKIMLRAFGDYVLERHY